MKILKLLLVGFVLLMSCGWVGPWDEWDVMSGPGVETSTLGQLQAIGGLTFYKDYSDPYLTSLNADYSVGDGTATFTRNDVACTYVDSAGVVQTVSTANVPRIASGYYDDTGFHAVTPGTMIESSRTNLLKTTIFNADTDSNGLADNWSNDVVDLSGTPVYSLEAETLTNIAGSQAQKFAYTAVGGDSSEVIWILYQTSAAGTFAQNDYASFSCYIKKTSSSGVSYNLRITELDSDGGSLATNHDSSALSIGAAGVWVKFTYSFKLTHADVSRCQFTVRASSISNGDSLDISIACPQGENGPYPTSFIPTTTATLTRGSEVCKYPTLGNRTAAQETIIIKFTPLGGGFANDGVIRRLITTKGSSRDILKEATATVLRFKPNSTDSGASLSDGTTDILVNTSYVVGVVAYQPSGNPNSDIYINGAIDGTVNNTDYIEPVFTDNFYIGTSNSATTHINSLIEEVAIFNRLLTASEVLAASNLM